jgi:hypothetical protein
MGEKVIINIRTFMDGHRPPDECCPRCCDAKAELDLHGLQTLRPLQYEAVMVCGAGTQWS